jgi:hypothetical protein
MPSSENLLAWVERRGPEEFAAAFVGEGAIPDAGRHYAGRLPAVQLCSSPEEAREWVQDQAATLDVPVKWVAEAPQGYRPRHS